MSRNHSVKKTIEVEGQVHIAYSIYIKVKKWVDEWIEGEWTDTDR